MAPNPGQRPSQGMTERALSRQEAVQVNQVNDQCVVPTLLRGESSRCSKDSLWAEASALDITWVAALFIRSPSLAVLVAAAGLADF
jgi:hypothetical protein